jgi:N-acetylneuraminate synthase
VALGAKVLEFHITLDRAMWGVDQTSSLEPQEAGLLIKYIREIEKSLGEGIKKIYNRELTISKKLKKHQF